MPTLFRLLLVIGTLILLVWLGMEAMVTYLEPEPRQIVHDVVLPSKS